MKAANCPNTITSVLPKQSASQNHFPQVDVVHNQGDVFHHGSLEEEIFQVGPQEIESHLKSSTLRTKTAHGHGHDAEYYRIAADLSCMFKDDIITSAYL